MILIDTNVILDVVLDRGEHAPAARALLNEVGRGRIQACVAWHGIATAFYITEREADRETALRLVQLLASSVEVPPTGTAQLLRALELPMTDFEDAMHAAAAELCGAEYIVTRDRTGFSNSPIPALEPQEALERLF